MSVSAADQGPIAGKYRLVRRLEEGAVNRFVGEHLAIRRPVEVHLLAADELPDGRAAARLLREARVLGGASHRNLQGVVDSGLDDAGRPWVVFELLRGECLEERLRAQPEGSSLARAGRVASQVLQAVGALHAAGVVLRALSPRWITIEQVSGGDDLVKVRLPAESAFVSEDAAPLPGELARSPYVAPELRGDVGALDPRADYFSMGALLAALLGGSPDARPDGERARRVIERATAVEPTGRYATLEDFAADLARLSPPRGLSAQNQRATPVDLSRVGASPPRGGDRLSRETLPEASGVKRRQARPAMRVHLLPALLAIEAFFRRGGESGWRALIEEVPEVERLLPGAGGTPDQIRSGIPAELFVALLRAADRLAGDGDLALIPEFGVAAATRGLRRLIPTLRVNAVPEDLLRSFPKLWSSISREGVAGSSVAPGGGGRAWVASLSDPSVELASFTAGLLEGALEAVGATDVTVELTAVAARGEGETRDVFTLKWK